MVFDLKRTNMRFRQLGRTILKLRWILLVLLVALNGVAIVGIQKVQMQSSWDSWFLDDDPIRRYTERFEEYFGNSNDAAILVTADDVFAPEVLRMLRELGTEIEQEVPYVDKVTTLSEFEFSRGTESGMLVGNLVPDEIPDDPAEIEEIRRLAFSKKNLVDRLFTRDSKQTWMAISFQEIPEDFAKESGKEPLYVIGQALKNVMARDKYQKFDLKDTGMPIVAVDKTDFFMGEMFRILVAALVTAVILLIITLRSVTGVVVPIFTMISSILVSYGFMGFTGIKIDAMAVSIPLYLGLAISIGYSIHIFNFFRRKFRECGQRQESILHAVENTGWPLFFTALTTIGSMLSFNFVDITTIRWIGNSSAAIILVVYFYAMIMTPILLSIGGDLKKGSKKLSDKPVWTDRFFERFGIRILGRGRAIVVFFTVLTLVFGYGLTKVQVDFDVFKGYGLKIPYVKRMWDITQSAIGSMYSYNILIELPEEGMAKDPARLRAFEELERRLKSREVTKSTSSILDILKDMNRTLHNGDESFYKIPESRDLVNQLLFLYEMSGGSDAKTWLDVEDGYQMLRLNVSVRRFIAAEVEEEMALIEQNVKELFPDSGFGMVGTFFEGAVIQNYVAKGQVTSFLIALSVIAVLMIIVFRSVKAGLIALIPNLIPVVLIGGVMGHLGIPLDMMSMTIVPMLMGIAVDDSIHFVNHIKLSVIEGLGYHEGVLHTFKTVGKALFMTSFILVATFSMYLTSITRFYVVLGSLVILGLTSALLANYLLAPNLIKWSRPFGRGEKDLATPGVQSRPVEVA